MTDIPDKWTMCWTITLNSNYNDDYLLSLPEEELYKLYLEKAEVHNGKKPKR